MSEVQEYQPLKPEDVNLFDLQSWVRYQTLAEAQMIHQMIREQFYDLMNAGTNEAHDFNAVLGNIRAYLCKWEVAEKAEVDPFVLDGVKEDTPEPVKQHYIKKSQQDMDYAKRNMKSMFRQAIRLVLAGTNPFGLIEWIAECDTMIEKSIENGREPSDYRVKGRATALQHMKTLREVLDTAIQKAEAGESIR